MQDFRWDHVLQKLTSRKLWVAVTAFVVLVLQSRGMDEGSIQQYAAMIMAGGTIIAYIFAEGWIDASREKHSEEIWIEVGEADDED